MATGCSKDSEKTINNCFHWRKVAQATSKHVEAEKLNIMATGCSAAGSALRLGRRGRTFEPCHPDHFKRTAFKDGSFL